MVILATVILLLTGCNHNADKVGDDSSNTTAVTTSEEKNDGLKDNSEGSSEEIVYATAEEFMEYYDISEEQIPKEYIQQFIKYYYVTPDELEEFDKYSGQSPYVLLIDNYDEGVNYKYLVASIFQGPGSDEALVDYIDKAEVICIEFGMHYGSELAYGECMTIDLREGKLYYSRSSEDDYSKSDLCVDLSEEDMALIRKELPNHIEENKGVTDFGGSDADYNFMINMRATDDSTKYYVGNQGDEENFPGFDEYWMGLYKKYFGEEYEYVEH